jgi:Flp pilus assembly pilin Flp
MLRNLVGFFKDEDGMGTVEIILIIVVLIGLVVIFKDGINTVVNNIITKIGTKADDV